MPSTTKSDHKIIYTVTLVTITSDTSVTGYDRDAAGLKEILTGVKKKEGWTADFDVDKKKHVVNRVTGLGYPEVGGHPGHTHNSSPGAWKYNIERGNNSVDRFVLEKWKAVVKSQAYTKNGKVDEIKLNLEITCDARVLVDTKK